MTDMLFSDGFIHGGVVAANLDSACGYSASTLMPATSGVLTVEFKINFLAPASGQHFKFQGRVKRSGKALTFTEGEAIAIQEGGKEKVFATMQATMMTIEGKEGIKH